MKRAWKDPVKDRPPLDSTLKVKGDFGLFTERMKSIIHMKPPRPKVRKPRAVSASPGAGES
jgi:hypothetical protein